MSWLRLRLLLLRHARALNGFLVSAWLASIALAIALGWRPRAWWFGSLFVLFLAMSLVATWARWQRERTIRERPLPQFLKRKLREHHPHLDGRNCDLVERGFRQFFVACLRSDKSFVAMPSKVVDGYWHEFILHTRAYADWCELTLGRFLHHTPAEALGARATDNDGLRRAWFWSCREESIQPKKPSRLPLLFALDAKLVIPGGFVYVADCSGILAPRTSEAGAVHCGSSFSDTRSPARPMAWAARTAAAMVAAMAGETEVAAAAATEPAARRATRRRPSAAAATIPSRPRAAPPSRT